MPIITITSLPAYVLIAVSTVVAVICVRSSLSLRRKLRDAVDEMACAKAEHEQDEVQHTEDLRAASGLIMRLKKEQEALELSKERFLEAISHELRTPLAGMMASVEILGEQLEEDPAATEWIAIAGQSTERLTHIVERIEEMVQLDASFTRGSFPMVAVEQVLGQFEEHVPALVGGRMLRFVVERPALPVGIAVSEQHFVRLLELLAENAVRFSPCGGEIRLRSEVVLDRRGDEDHLRFTLEDEGPGIPEEELPYIFDSFHQVRRPQLGKPPGLGLGLSICRSLAASLGSEICVWRRSDAGAAFAFELPCFFRSPVDRLEVPAGDVCEWVHAAETAESTV